MKGYKLYLSSSLFQERVKVVQKRFLDTMCVLGSRYLFIHYYNQKIVMEAMILLNILGNLNTPCIRC